MQNSEYVRLLKETILSVTSLKTAYEKEIINRNDILESTGPLIDFMHDALVAFLKSEERKIKNKSKVRTGSPGMFDEMAASSDYHSFTKLR